MKVTLSAIGALLAVGACCEAARAGSLTAADLGIVPLATSVPGSLELSVQGSYVTLPAAPGYAGADVGLELGLPGDAKLVAEAGPLTTIGVAGALWRGSRAVVGWQAGYRADSYPEDGAGKPATFGLTASPALANHQGSLMPGRFAQGGQAALPVEYGFGPLRAYLEPELLLMANRDAVGTALGLDYRLGRLAIGIGGDFQANVGNPDRAIRLNPFQALYGAGLRYDLDRRIYLAAAYHLVPADAYGFRSQSLTAGVGARLGAGTATPEDAAEFSRDSVLVTDCVTVAGLDIAPRYLGRPGDVDELLKGALQGTQGTFSFDQGQLNQVRLPGSMVLLTQSGPLTQVGLRAPLLERDGSGVGWDVRYRAENLAGGGSTSRGAQLALDGEYRQGDLEAYAAPEAFALTDRGGFGAAAGVDLQIDRLGLGLGAEAQDNLFDPDRGVPLNPLQMRYSAGLRYYVNGWSYLQASYHVVPADARGIPSQSLEVGLSSRLLGAFTKQDDSAGSSRQ